MSRFGKAVAVMQAAVTSPRTITSVSPAEGCGVASGKYFDSDGCTSASTSSTRRPMSANSAPRLAVRVVLPTPPFVLVTVNLIIDSVPIQVCHQAYGIARESVGLLLQIIAKPLIRENLADAPDLLVQGAARNSEPLGGLFDGQPLLAEHLAQLPLDRRQPSQGAADVDARVVVIDGTGRVLLGGFVVSQQIGERQPIARAVERCIE